MSIGVRIDVSGLGGVVAALQRLAALPREQLMDGLGRLGASQTQRRIQSEKRSPEGRRWKPNAHGGSILFATGSNLSDSIDHRSTATEAAWGTGWIGARIHQFGGVIKPQAGKRLAFSVGGKKVFAKSVTIPARPFLGVSADNQRELEETAARFIERALR
jgi:phage gpG-like protein